MNPHHTNTGKFNFAPANMHKAAATGAVQRTASTHLPPPVTQAPKTKADSPLLAQSKTGT